MQFRPAIIIFVGPEGKLTAPGAPGVSVLAHFTDICAGLHPAQRQGIGMIAVGEGERQARPLSLQTRDDGSPCFPDMMPAQPDDFPRLFENMMSYVMNARLLKDIEGSGFSVPLPHAQIFIVAHSSSTWISRVAGWVGEVLKHERITTNIVYLLIDVPRYLGEVGASTLGNGHAASAAPLADADLSFGTGDAVPPDDSAAFLFSSAQAAFDGAGRASGALSGDSPQFERRIPPIWVYDLTARGGALPLINFCFVYQRLAQDDRYYDESDVRFGVAEALFTFVASSVSTAENFGEVMRVGPNIQPADADSRIGSFATSLIRFPRAEVERFCADMLGADLMREWHEATQRRGANATERKQQEAAAKRLGENILDGLSDSEARPGTDDCGDEQAYLWPTLAFVRDRELLTEFREMTQDLFDNFRPEVVEEFVVDDGNWTSVVEQREAKTAAFLPNWKQKAEQVWGEARRQLETEVDQTVLKLWLTDESGTALAQQYIKRLNTALERLDGFFVEWRKGHREEYESQFARLRELSERGPWYTPPGESQIVGPRGAEPITQAVPRYLPDDPSGGARPPVNADFPPDESDSGESARQQQNAAVAVETLDRMEPAAHVSNAYLPDSEREVAARLGERAKHLRTQIPTVANLIAVTAVADPALILLTLTLIPADWARQPFIAAAVALAVIGMTAVAGWIIRALALAGYEGARQDVLAINRLYYAYQCQQWEDQLRAVVRGRLSRNVRRMQDRLVNIDAFIQSIQGELLANARRTQDALFNGPSGLRDVFVANARELSPFEFTLEDLYTEVRRRMRASSNGQHDDSPRDMIARLRETLARDGANLLRMQDQEIEVRVRLFVQASVARQLHGDLVSVAEALHGPGEAGKRIWQTSLRSAVIQYRPYTNAPILTYIGGQDNQRATVPKTAIPPATTMVRTRNDEWLGLMRFWTGGARSQWATLTTDDAPLEHRMRTSPSWTHS